MQSAPSLIPKHVAIIMDGNGRWAQRQGKPRHAGHRAGVESVRKVIETSDEAGVQVLTLFAFSSENWQRPKAEVTLLMDLFLSALKREVSRLHKNRVRMKVIGDIAPFPAKLRAKIHDAEAQTADNDGLLLQIAANYGGRWDITQAMRSLALQIQQGTLAVSDINECKVSENLCFAGEPDPDLFIRTGGEQRISNFLLWQSAYSELYFTETLWPDFDADCYQQALQAYSGRQRRFGLTGSQVVTAES